MDTVESLLKLISLIAGAFAVAKIAIELTGSRRSQVREEYRFAREFLNDLSRSPNMHPFLRQKGYQAIAGDMQLNATEVEYLLSLPEPARDLRLYVLGLPYLRHNAALIGLQVSFKPEFTADRKRWFLKKFYYAGYLLFYLAGAIPLVHIPLQYLNVSLPPSIKAMVLLVCWPIALYMLWSTIRIDAAEDLIAKHTRLARQPGR